MIKNIVFDIGNVLVRFQPDEAMREIGIEENKIAALAHATYENPVWVELDRGVIPENEIIDEMVKVAPQYEADIRRFFKEGKAFVVKAFDYAADWIKELKSRGYKVYLLSNYPKEYFELHTHSELSFVSLVDGKVISAMVGMKMTIFDEQLQIFKIREALVTRALRDYMKLDKTNVTITIDEC